MKRLTEQERWAVNEYLVDLNQTRACIAAGYDKVNIGPFAGELFSRPHIDAAVQTAMYWRAQRLRLSQDRVIEEIACPALVDPITMFDEDGSLLEIPDMPESTRRAIASVKVRTVKKSGGATETTTEIRFSPKTEALTALGKHLGMWRTKFDLPDLKELSDDELRDVARGIVPLRLLKGKRSA